MSKMRAMIVDVPLAPLGRDHVLPLARQVTRRTRANSEKAWSYLPRLTGQANDNRVRSKCLHFAGIARRFTTARGVVVGIGGLYAGAKVLF
jgi:hypothetical protein